MKDRFDIIVMVLVFFILVGSVGTYVYYHTDFSNENYRDLEPFSISPEFGIKYSVNSGETIVETGCNSSNNSIGTQYLVVNSVVGDTVYYSIISVVGDSYLEETKYGNKEDFLSAHPEEYSTKPGYNKVTSYNVPVRCEYGLFKATRYLVTYEYEEYGFRVEGKVEYYEKDGLLLKKEYNESSTKGKIVHTSNVTQVMNDLFSQEKELKYSKDPQVANYILSVGTIYTGIKIVTQEDDGKKRDISTVTETYYITNLVGNTVSYHLTLEKEDGIIIESDIISTVDELMKNSMQAYLGNDYSLHQIGYKTIKTNTGEVLTEFRNYSKENICTLESITVCTIGGFTMSYVKEITQKDGVIETTTWTVKTVMSS